MTPIETTLAEETAQQWLSEGVIEPVHRRLPWTNNLVFVAKKDGSSRMCVDCTPVNDVTKDFEWPLPRLQDIRHRTMGASWFSRLDLKSAFFRIGVPQSWRWATSFEVRGRQYQFRKMPFGLKTAPAVFQRYMDHVLADFSGWCVCYIDDILISAETRTELADRTARVLRKLKRSGAEVSHGKCEYEKQGLLFAGMWIYAGGTGPNHDKVRDILATPVPRTKEQKQSALGLVSYLRDHIPLVSHLTAELYPNEKEERLTDTEYEKQWRRLLTHVSRHVTTLSCWNESLPADLYTDASGSALSAMVIQNGRIVALTSRKLTPAESRYSATDREHLALVQAAKKFPLFLHRRGAATRVHSDHAALINRDMSQMTPRQTRWATLVNQWIPTLQHVKGKNNPADFPSRWPVDLLGGQISCT